MRKCGRWKVQETPLTRGLKRAGFLMVCGAPGLTRAAGRRPCPSPKCIRGTAAILSMATKTRSRRGRKASEGPSPAEAIVADSHQLLERHARLGASPGSSGGGHTRQSALRSPLQAAQSDPAHLGMHLGVPPPFCGGFAEAKKLESLPQEGLKAVRNPCGPAAQPRRAGEGGEIS